MSVCSGQHVSGQTVASSPVRGGGGGPGAGGGGWHYSAVISGEGKEGGREGVLWDCPSLEGLALHQTMTRMGLSAKRN